MELLSLPFLLLCVGTAIWTNVVRGSARSAGLGLACLTFAFSHLGFVGSASTLSFCLGGYGCAIVARRGRRSAALGVLALTAAFVFLRGYGVVLWMVPMDWREGLIATAGLSFLFFKILHVVIESASGTLPELRLATYLLYCFNFTTFLLGPIQRYPDFDSQWAGRRPSIDPTFAAHLDAANRILRGLVKKFVLAELLAGFALQPGADVTALSAGEVVIALYAFYFLLYFDFSGYCDIAIGAGQLIGIRPPENFQLPFLAPNVAQFWLRFHRSLTLWITDYIFNPAFAWILRRRTAVSSPLASTIGVLLLTMTIAGVWHGTTLAFAAYGLLHGLYLAGFRIFEHVAARALGRDGLKRLRERAWWRILSVLLTFQLTSFAFVFFVLDLDSALELFARAFLG